MAHARADHWTSERGEVASWLIVLAALAAAAVGASAVLSATIGTLADNVAQAAVGDAPSPRTGTPPTAGSGAGGGDQGDGSASQITLGDGSTGVQVQGNDGQVSLISVDDDGNVQIIHVDAEGTVELAQVEANEDESGWSASGWHFEGRDDLNTNLPPTLGDAESGDGWTRLSVGQSVFHDDPATPDPEIKFINADGREAVYNPETGALVTDPRYAGTYNYVNPAPTPESATDVTGWLNWTVRGIGHGVTDVIPYWFGGNVRGPDDD